MAWYMKTGKLSFEGPVGLEDVEADDEVIGAAFAVEDHQGAFVAFDQALDADRGNVELHRGFDDELGEVEAGSMGWSRFQSRMVLSSV